MGRRVRTDWFLFFIKAKAYFAEMGESATANEVAHRLKIHPKLMSRILIGGRFVERYLPHITPEQIRCSYVSMEYLDKIMRISPVVCQELIPRALTNELKIDEIRKHLDDLRFKHPLLSSSFNERSEKRRDSRSTRRRLLSLLPTLDTSLFGVKEGAYHQVAPNPYISPAAIIVKNDGSYGAAIFTKVGGDSKDYREVAMDMYEFAVLRKSLAPRIWLVFPRRSDIFNCLAEIKLHFDGRAVSEEEQWLRLAYLNEAEGRSELVVFDEQERNDLELEIANGNRRFDPKCLELQLKPLPVVESIS